MLLVAVTHRENMGLSELGLWWQGGEGVRASAVICCIAGRESAAVSSARLWAVEEYWVEMCSRKGVFGPEEEQMGPEEASGPGQVSVVQWP